MRSRTRRGARVVSPATRGSRADGPQGRGYKLAASPRRVAGARRNFTTATGFEYRMKIISSKFTVTVLAALSSCALALAEDAKPAAPPATGDAKPADAKPGRAGGARPEGGARRPMDPDARAKEMQTSLGLTDDQTAKVKAVLEKNREKNGEEMKKLREDTTLSQED